MKEEIVFEGKIGEVVYFTQPDGRVFEQYRRPPGTRLIIVSPENKVLITREHRHETGNVDYRLPGGKVYDTLEQYNEHRNGDMSQAAIAGAIREASEECGLDISNPKLITIAKAGATVEWDLYYFVVREYTEIETGQSLEQGEDIEITWLTPAEIRQAIKAGQIQEWRSVGVLLGKVLPELEAK
jgi:8-oxo-dGTP pyrophosphatase MutT (NUDIX family)